MKVKGYLVYGEPYCLDCSENLDLVLEEEELEPIFSSDVFPTTLFCIECHEEILPAGLAISEEEVDYELEVEEEEEDEDLEEADWEEIDGGREEKGKEKNFTCSSCPLRDFCPEAFNDENLDGACSTGWFYDLEEEGEG